MPSNRHMNPAARRRAHGLRRRVLSGTLAASLVLAGTTGCSLTGVISGDLFGGDETTSSSNAGTTSGTSAGTIDASDLFSDRDLDPSYDEADAETITLSDDGSSSTSDAVQIDGSTITITAEGIYVVSGTLADGQIVVDADGAKVQIVLDGTSISSSSSSAIYVSAADKVFLTLADGSENSLAASGADETVDDHNVDGCVFATSDLTINGDGTLSVASEQGNGIVCKDELALVSGDVSVTAAGHAVQANDQIGFADGTWELTGGTDAINCANDEDSTLGNVVIEGGTLELVAGSDGIDAGGVLQIDGGTITVDAADDGIHAEYDLYVNDGSITVSQSEEAVEGATVTITGGELDLTASDDGINASGDPDDSSSDSTDSSQSGGMGGSMEVDDTADLTISGGTVIVDASGDGLDSNGTFEMSGGTVYVSGPTDSGNGAIDYGSEATISGGTIIAAGSSGMAETFSESSSQASAIVYLDSSTTGEIVLTDADGNEIASFTPDKEYSCVVVSSPEMEEGETFTLTCGSQTTELELTGAVTSSGSGSSAGMGGMGAQGSSGMGGAPAGGMPGSGSDSSSAASGSGQGAAGMST